MTSPIRPPTRLLLLASEGYQSLVTLQELLRLELAPMAVAVATDTPRAITSNLGGITLNTAPTPSPLALLADQQSIPVIDGHPTTLSDFIDQNPVDLLLSSCYPHKLPTDLLDHPAHGCFNLHPSLLPAYRGPSPIFRQLQDGCRHPGVSVHQMSPSLDAGDLLYQEAVTLPDGASYHDWVERLTRVGVTGFATRLHAWLDGTIMPTPQQGSGSYHPGPGERDWLVDPDWPIPRLYSFICGVQELGIALLPLPDGSIYRIDRILDYLPGRDRPRSHRWSAQALSLQGAGGQLTLAVTHDYHSPLNPPRSPR